MLFSMALPPLLVTLYAIVFVLAAFVPKDFLAVAFDSGGVTTGPMTVPFIMALGVGISAIRSDRHAADDSFGLVALCSIGPILAVLIWASLQPRRKQLHRRVPAGYSGLGGAVGPLHGGAARLF